jgi:hypothetical protein
MEPPPLPAVVEPLPALLELVPAFELPPEVEPETGVVSGMRAVASGEEQPEAKLVASAMPLRTNSDTRPMLVMRYLREAVLADYDTHIESGSAGLLVVRRYGWAQAITV